MQYNYFTKHYCHFVITVKRFIYAHFFCRGKDNELLLDHDKNGTSNASDTRPPPRPPKLKL